MANTVIGISDERLAQVKALFEQTFGSLEGKRALVVNAPGRSEIAGNHTDHEGGHVIAGALDVSIVGIAVENGTDTIRVVDADFPLFELDLASGLEAREDEHVTGISLARGMAACLAETGRTPRGFDLAKIGNIPAGGGLSSSAAVEALYGRVMEAFWEGPEISPVQLAQMSQRAENEYFGKPCGLMDQLAVCLGGLAFMDFENPEPRAQKLDFDFDAHGFGLVLVDVGCDHAPFTDDYAAVPVEMQAVAREFGHARLCEVDPVEFNEKLPQVREKLGDRALVRAIHYWYENDLVDRRWDSLNAGDVATFLKLTRESGASSGMFLQNVSTGGSFQPAMAALGMAEHILDGCGAIRIHGGGFGGSIQCFVPVDMLEDFIAQMDAWLGEGACRHYHISDEGAVAAWL